MRKCLAISLFVLAGCSASPTRPTVESTDASREATLLLMHNIPATMPDGTVMWVCTTQLRRYAPAVACTTDTDCAIKNPHLCGGPSEPTRSFERGLPPVPECSDSPMRDHYIQSTPCPEVPID